MPLGSSDSYEKRQVDIWSREFIESHKKALRELLKSIESKLDESTGKVEPLLFAALLRSLIWLNIYSQSEIANKTGLQVEKLNHWVGHFREHDVSTKDFPAAPVAESILRTVITCLGLKVGKSVSENKPAKMPPVETLNGLTLPPGVSGEDILIQLPGWSKLSARLRNSLFAVEVWSVRDLVSLAAFKAKNPTVTEGLSWQEVLLKVPGIGTASRGLLLKYLADLGFRWTGRS